VTPLGARGGASPGWIFEAGAVRAISMTTRDATAASGGKAPGGRAVGGRGGGDDRGAQMRTAVVGHSTPRSRKLTKRPASPSTR
jgi:hypothetical protein